MKTIIKNNLPWLIIIAVLLIIIGYVIIKKNHDLNTQRSDYQKAQQYQDEAIQVLKDKNDSLVSYQKSILNINENVARQYYKGKLDSISSQLGIKQKKIQELTELALNSSNSGATKTKVIFDTVNTSDTVHAIYSWDWNDNFLTISGESRFDSTYLKYIYKDSLSIVGYSKNTGFLGLGKKDLFVNVKSYNPNTKITYLQSIKFDKRIQKNWGIGPAVGYYYIPKLNKFYPAIGISIQYNLIKF